MKRTGIMLAAFGLFLFVQTAQADWTTIKRITWTSGGSYAQALAIDSNDAIHVVWVDTTPGDPQIFYRKSTNGGATWSGAKQLTWTSSDMRFPAIAIDSNDNIHVAWEDWWDWEIYYRRSTDGGSTWTQTKRLTWTWTSSDNPALATGTDSNIHFVWSEKIYPAINNSEIFYKRSTNWGSTWSSTQTQKLIARPGISSDPAIAVDSNNFVHVAWVEDSYGSEIFYKRSTDGGTTWRALRELTTTSGVYSVMPAMATGSNNTVHLVWADSEAGNKEIYYMRSSNRGASWSAAKRLSWTPVESIVPNIAVDSSNTIHVVWFDQASSPNFIQILYMSSTDGGTTWNTPEELTWYSGTFYEYLDLGPDIAVDSADNIYVLWNEAGDIYYMKSK